MARYRRATRLPSSLARKPLHTPRVALGYVSSSTPRYISTVRTQTSPLYELIIVLQVRRHAVAKTKRKANLLASVPPRPLSAQARLQWHPLASTPRAVGGDWDQLLSAPVLKRIRCDLPELFTRPEVPPTWTCRAITLRRTRKKVSPSPISTSACCARYPCTSPRPRSPSPICALTRPAPHVLAEASRTNHAQ